MRYIANAVMGENKFDMDKSVKRCRTMSEAIPSLPTLVIGMDNAESVIKGFSILKKDYPEQKLYWTFSKTERKCDYDEDTDAFFEKCLKMVYGSVRYEYVNVLTMRLSEARRLIGALKSSVAKTMYVENNHLFVYVNGSGVVYGVSLGMCRYVGIDGDKVTHFVSGCPNTVVVSDVSFISYRIRRIIAENRHYILPLSEYFR